MKFQSKFVKVLVMSFLIMMTIIACSATGAGGDVEPDIDSEAGSAQVDLNGTSWVLEQFGSEDSLTAVLPDSTITLNFTEEGIAGSAGCNNYFGEATQAGDSLTFGVIGSTRRACLEEAVMAQENDYLAALATVSGFMLEDEQLTLHYEDGILVFTAQTEEESGSDADADVDSDAASKTVFVGSELVDCVGVAPQKCMLVRESADEEWTFFYDQIVGFEFEPGFEYELLVTETEVDNPPADASSIQVTLVEVVSKTAVASTPDSRPEGSTLSGTSWILITFGPEDNQTALLPDTEITLNVDSNQINGSAGCNSYFGEVTAEGETIAFGQIGTTLMACAEDVMQQESDFLAALAKVTGYTLENNQLTLHYDNGFMIFEAIA